MTRLNGRGRVQGGFWRALEAVGVKDARARWETQSPLLQRAVPPLVIAALVLGLAWLARVPPHPTFLTLLAVVYALYLLPRRARRIALPLTVLGIALIYPILWANELSGTNTLFEIPVFKAFPNMDTMIAIAIFSMMAIGLNMVVGYAGLLDLGYVAFYAIGAYTAAWLASPHFAANGVDFDFGRDRRAGGRRRHPHLDLDRPRRRRDHDSRCRSAHRLARRFGCAATTSRSSRSASARSSPRSPERRRRRDQRADRLQDGLQPHERRRSGSTRSTRRASAIWLSDAPRLARGLHRRERLVRELRQPRLLVGDRRSC